MTMTESAPEVLRDEEYDAALTRVAAYRDQLEHADKQADQNSLDRARDLELLYQSMRWVDEVPAPKNKVWRGRPVDPRSRNRFATWTLQKTGLNPSRVRQLHNAREMLDGLIDTGVTVNPVGERALRPFGRLRRAGYGDRLGDVYKMALQLAEGRSPTARETSQAVRDYLAQFSTGQRRERSKAEVARSHRAKAQTAVEVLWHDGDQAEAEAFHNWYIALVRKAAEAGS
jgi:hypothetical protein